MDPQEPSLKMCVNCKEYKHASEFHKQGKRKPRRADCDECRRRTVRKYHASVRAEREKQQGDDIVHQ